MFTNYVRQMSTRIPMIKFRQGGIPHGGATQSGTQSNAGSGPQGAKSNKVVSSQVIEDWQLPRRYRRRPISEDECQIINMGGAP